jgi:orotate phosphoribosyltransferase
MDAIEWSATDVAAGSASSRDIPSTELESKRTFLRREKLRAFIDDRCIKRVPKNSKEMLSMVPGQFYWWQFYLREAVLEPEHLAFISEQFWHSFEKRFREKPFQLAGVEQASVPILTALLLSGAVRGLLIHAFTIRKDYKTHGIGNIIEGRPSDLPVLFVDDLTSPQHMTFWHAVRVIGRASLKLYPFAFVLVRKQLQTEAPWIITSIGKVKVESIFTLDDFALTYEDYHARHL